MKAKKVQRRSREETKQIGEDASTGVFRCEHRSIPPDHPVAIEAAGKEHSSTGSFDAHLDTTGPSGGYGQNGQKVLE
jgi:hypothetical protein